MRQGIERLRKEYPEGTRVKLLKMDDIQAPPIGTKGSVTGVDDIGTIHVNWDGGGSLGVCLDVDEIEKLETYYVTHMISGTYTALVEAASMEEILELADQELCDTDFGKLENIEWDTKNPIDVSVAE